MKKIDLERVPYTVGTKIWNRLNPDKGPLIVDSDDGGSKIYCLDVNDELKQRYAALYTDVEPIVEKRSRSWERVWWWAAASMSVALSSLFGLEIFTERLEEPAPVLEK